MQANFTISSYHFATLRFDEAQVNGYGAAVAPRLMMQFRLDISYPKIGTDRRIDLLRMTGRIQIGQNIYIDAIPATIGLSLTHRFHTNPDYAVTLEFPTTPAVIAALERERAGGNLKATLWANLDYEDLRLAGKSGETDVWALAERARMQATPSMEFPSSAWITRVLPQIGYGVVHVLELPAVQLEEYENYRDAFTALKQANDFHRSGHYNDVAARCRMALEKFMEHVEVPAEKGKKKKIHRLKISWQTRLGKATYEWLNSCFSTSKIAANPTAHSPNQHFDQLESQMLLAITTGLVAYAARSGPGAQQQPK